MPPVKKKPRAISKEIERVLISETEIAKRVRSLAATIQKDFLGTDLVIVSLLNGTVLFLADLIRHIDLPLRLDFIGVSSYGSGTTSRDLVFTKDLRIDVKGRDVLVIDDILDTGKTMAAVLKKVSALKPNSLHTCVLLDKPSRREKSITADYIGFEIPDEFVVGYGLDFAEHNRNLPYIGVLKTEVYETS